MVIPQEIAMAKALTADPERAVAEVCEVLKISFSTYYRHIYRSNVFDKVR